MSGSITNPGASNAWKSFDDWCDMLFHSNPAVKQIQEEVSRKLFDDGCHSAWVHKAKFVERLLEIIEEQGEELAYYIKRPN